MLNIIYNKSVKVSISNIILTIFCFDAEMRQISSEEEKTTGADRENLFFEYINSD